jgi:hypothetical protein
MLSGSSAMSANTGGDARVSEDYLNTDVWRDNDLFLSFRISWYQTRILINPRPDIDARCSFHSLSPKHPDANFTHPKPLSQLQNRHSPSLDSGPGLSASSTTLRFRNSTISSNVSAWSRDFSISNSSSAQYVLFCVLGLIYCVSGGKRREWGAT